MKKIAITGSLASGKTSASKILSLNKGPLFSADYVVKELYRKKFFRKIISKKFNIPNILSIKKVLKRRILRDKKKLILLEKIIHPLVRKEMKKFISLNKSKKFLFFEIPLLVESNLMRKFDIIIFIKSSKSKRLKRFVSKGGNKKLFNMLNKKQLPDFKKIKYCDYVIVNNKDLKFLKKNLSGILRKYE